MMTILGIDPGTATTGYAVIQSTKRAGEFKAVAFGVITTKKTSSDAERLAILAADLSQIIEKYKPDRVGVEKLFFATNQKTAITVAQARGIVLLSSQQHHLPIFEFTPLQVKSTLCGYGQADKKQVQFMVKKCFNLKTIPKP